MSTSQPDNNAQQSSYLIAATTTTTAINSGNEKPALCDIKILCAQKKKKCKEYIYLTFIESCSLLSSSNEEPCIEIIDKSKISLNDCISFEYFDEIKNDFQSFIYIYFQSYTISIYFTDEHIHKKSIIIKHLEYMYKQKSESSTDINNPQLSQELPCLKTTEQILHTFDIKLIPYESIITRDHSLVGRVRIYFTSTDLYIASKDCNIIDLKTTITNQCPSKDKNILCIPYFTIKHYGNRSNIFLIELGKSNYGNGEIHMKCLSSSLASTIHLLVSPVIEERPLALSSAFQNQLLTNKRIEKSKNIHPPIPLNKERANSLLPFIKKHSIQSLPEQPTKSRSVFSFIRKLVKNSNSLEQSSTFDNNQCLQSNISSSTINKFFELNIGERKYSNDQNHIISSKPQIINNQPSLTSSNRQESMIGTYIDMSPTIQKSNQNQQEEIQDEEIIKEPRATVDIGVNTTISLSPHVHSAIIVGTSVHLIAEERAVFPIGQRSFTSPASVMQPFKAQLSRQRPLNPYPPLTDMITCDANSSNSFHQSISPTNSHKSLLLSYGIVTFNNNQLDLSDGSTIDHRLNSDVSVMSLSHQQQPSNIYSLDNILSSSPSSSQIFRTLSPSTNNIGDNTSGHIILFDENYSDQTTTYLLGPLSTAFIDDTDLSKSILHSHLSHIDEEKLSLNDCYALIEPLNLQNSSTISTKPSINYTIEEKSERSSSIFYTDIDFHQTQRRDRIAKFAEISKIEDQITTFVL